MNNEPVAWMLADKEKEHIRSIMAVQHDFVPEGCVEIPLYTHPADLTDEEMYQLASECGFNVDGKAINDGIETAADFHDELFDFAKAILRKAQEK